MQWKNYINLTIPTCVEKSIVVISLYVLFAVGGHVARQAAFREHPRGGLHDVHGGVSREIKLQTTKRIVNFLLQHMSGEQWLREMVYLTHLMKEWITCPRCV